MNPTSQAPVKHRARYIATASIVVAAGGALLCLPFRSHPLGAAGFALFEAAMVGGFADWFAVTALFRHPLGQRWIPHTAIIPANRDRIIDNLVNLVENRLLNRESLQQRLARTPLALPLLDAIRDEATLRGAADFLARHAAGRLRKEPSASLAALLQRPLDERLLKRPARELWQDLREDWLDQARLEDWLSAGFRGLAKLPAGPTLSTTIRSTLEHMTDKFLEGNAFASLARGFLDQDKLTKLVIEGLETRLLKAADDESDPLRQAMRKVCDPADPHPGLERILERLQLSPKEMQPPLAERLARQIQQQGASWLESAEGRDQLYGLFRRGLEEVENSSENLGRLDVFLRARLLQLAEKHHTKIGEMVRENLQVLSARQFSDELEERVGQDLQWIRVNGAVVGGLVGLLLHGLLKLL